MLAKTTGQEGLHLMNASMSAVSTYSLNAILAFLKKQAGLVFYRARGADNASLQRIPDNPSTESVSGQDSSMRNPTDADLKSLSGKYE
jgi:hypothetical protein